MKKPIRVYAAVTTNDTPAARLWMLAAIAAFESMGLRPADKGEKR